MNPFDPALLERLCAAAEAPAPTSTPAPNGWRSSVYAELQPGGVQQWKADWEITPEAEAAEQAVVEALMDATARLGSWEAARSLFAPDTPCAGLYATQSPASHLSRVVVPPEAHKPAQPLPTPNP